ncbi:ATP-dependent endonuclease [Streptomyces venezuelae]|uniref:AAA family ATPase n=1 Tax=Streptomyces venezuelae TaxID=54571 RepID=UPI00123CBA78|nr:AAA family ATPase [Streptomyces venezuelae]QES12153.1 ATP-dependent endonuclease [Streptomyces venezuelae]
MKIKRVRIENFCCLHKVDIAFDEITSFIGPTGVGKSTVLRALDWFFNGEKSVALTTDDIHSAVAGAGGERISVEVEFDGLTDFDRDALGRYAPDDATTVSIWRTWDNGEEKITGKALAYAPFDEIRSVLGGAMAKRRAYNELRESTPSLGLPPAGSEKAVNEAMLAWERAHRDQLTEAEVEDTHFFGFAGQSKLAQLIDFVFVSADLRAYEEADDQKASAIARILDHAIDRTEADAQLGEIEESAQLARQVVHDNVYGPALKDLSDALSAEVAKLTTGRQVIVTPTVRAPRPAKTAFQVSIKDGGAETSVYRQGHGFQRALIIAALKYLADRRRPEGGTRTLCLAVEEPELFQHPPQARTFAKVLRELVTSSVEGRTQVMYATHSPVFIDPAGYHQVRRLTRDAWAEHPVTRVRQVTEDELCRSLEGLVKEEAVRRRTGVAMAGSLAEAFFAHAAVLGEGTTDGALLEGCAERNGINLGAEGITYVDVTGRDNLLLSHAILSAMGVPCHVVFDGDAGMEERKRESVRHLDEEKRTEKEAAFEQQARKISGSNADLLGYLGESRSPWPATGSGSTYTVFEDNLETYLGESWPSWGERKQQLIDAGEGASDKNAATYREAARTAATAPPYILQAMLENVRGMVR